jgi:chitinase
MTRDGSTDFPHALFLTLAIWLTLFTCSASALARDQPKVLAGYFEEWSIYGANYNIANIQQNRVASRITHLLYAFGNVAPTTGAPDALCHLADSWADYQTPNLPSVSGAPYPGPLYGNFAALQQLKELHPNLKVLISLGGASPANTAGFAYAASTPALRSQLVASCLDLFINGNLGGGVSAAGIFDGIDIDWEFPGAADKGNFTLLLKEFRTQLDALGRASHTHYQLTIAAPAGSQNYSNMQLAKVAAQLDFLNLETYDYHGTWESTTNHASPLYPSPKDPAYGQGFDTEDTVQAYLAAGVPSKKLVLGIPFYGRGWTGVPATHHGLYQSSTGPAPSPTGDTLATDGVATFLSLKNQTGYQHYFDRISLSQWIYNSSTETFWTYDDPTTIRLKMFYVLNRVPHGLGGAFFWAFKDDDATGTLAKTMARGLSE